MDDTGPAAAGQKRAPGLKVIRTGVRRGSSLPVGPVLSPEWGGWLREHRRAAGLSIRALAYAAGYDPSYGTLMERDGRVPHVRYVAAIAEMLGAEPDEALVMAGYAPRGVGWRELSDHLKAPQRVAALTPELRQALMRVEGLPPEQQRNALIMLRAFTTTIQGQGHR